MTQRDREFGAFGEFVRRSLYAAAESVVIGQDGLDRIRGRLAADRSADAAEPGECAALTGRALRVPARPGAVESQRC